MQIISRIVAGGFGSEDRPNLYAGTPPLESQKAVISIAVSHKLTFSIMHIPVSRAYFHAEAHRHVLVRLQVEDRLSADAGEIGVKKRVWQSRRSEQLGA